MFYFEIVQAIAIIILMVSVTQIVKAKKIEKPALVIILLSYLCGLIYFTMFKGLRHGLGGVSIKFPLPFWRAIQTQHFGLTTMRSVLNLLLFVPFGYLASQLWARSTKKAMPQWWVITGAGLLTSLLIETGQLIFRCGVFELVDLVKNTLGAFAGFLIWKLLYWRNHADADK